MFGRAFAALCMAVLCGHTLVCAQADLYDPGTVHEIRIHFHEPDWRHIMDSLFLVGEDERLIGDVTIDGAFLPDVGVRWKGYSSYSPTQMKNPFNIKLDEVHTGQDHQGFQKLKLSNVYQDPSFLRETLSYEIARKYMPASQANYAMVYVNDTLQGLYTNVEDVSKDFLKEHFGSRSGSFFKCNPPTVDLTGENCNLGTWPGTDSTDYYDVYDLQSDAGWGHLLELIDVLNNDPVSIDQVLNVDRALWMHAFNYALVNFDSYVGYAQNYYVYRDEWDRWNTIPWDLNMSFASFRLTDASTYWNGFNIQQAITMDPLSHHGSGVSVLPRPFMRNLFANGMYRRMYLAHLRTIINENIVSGDYVLRALELRALIDASVQADTNKFYTYQHFLDNLDQSVSVITSFPGLTELMDQRADFLASYTGIPGGPGIGTPAHAPEGISVGGALSITAAISSADTAFLAYRSGDEGLFDHTAMLDDGQHGDGQAGDGVFGASITAASNIITYYIYAENDSAGAFSPEAAAHVTHRIETRLSPGDLVINELMAYNTGLVVDEDGSASDWIELFNASGHAISTAGLHLSDDPATPLKWELPAVTLDAGEYLIVWADEGDGDDHANFKLDAQGETLVLAYDDTTFVDQVTFDAQYPIYTHGRLPNGTGPFQRLTPTFGTFNRNSDDQDVSRVFQVWPNPANDQVFAIVDVDGPFEVSVFRADGKHVAGPRTHGTGELVQIDTHSFTSGHYVIQVRTADAVLVQPFVIIP